MKIIDRFPPANIEVRPPCEAVLSRYVVEQNRNWLARGNDGGTLFKIRREKGLDQEHCGLNARYLIDGKYYCRKHAAYYVLDQLAKSTSK